MAGRGADSENGAGATRCGRVSGLRERIRRSRSTHQVWLGREAQRAAHGEVASRRVAMQSISTASVAIADIFDCMAASAWMEAGSP